MQIYCGITVEQEIEAAERVEKELERRQELIETKVKLTEELRKVKEVERIINEELWKLVSLLGTCALEPKFTVHLSEATTCAHCYPHVWPQCNTPILLHSIMYMYYAQLHIVLLLI